MIFYYLPVLWNYKDITFQHIYLIFFFYIQYNQEKLNNNIALALRIPFSLSSKGLETTTKAFSKYYLLDFKHLLNFECVLNIWYVYSTTKANYNVHSKFVFPCYDLAVELYDKTRGS